MRYEATLAECTEDQFRLAMYEDPEPSAAWLAERAMTMEEKALAKRLRADLESVGGGRRG